MEQAAVEAKRPLFVATLIAVLLIEERGDREVEAQNVAKVDRSRIITVPVLTLFFIVALWR